MRIARAVKRGDLKQQQQEQMSDAIEEEFKGIVGFGALEEAKSEDELPEGVSISSSRFALAIKDEEGN